MHITTYEQNFILSIPMFAGLNFIIIIHLELTDPRIGVNFDIIMESQNYISPRNTHSDKYFFPGYLYSNQI